MCNNFFKKYFTFVKQFKTMAQKVHTGMRIDSDQLDKLKFISWHDRRSFTTVMDFAIEDYLKKWETANGAITQKQIEDAKIR